MFEIQYTWLNLVMYKGAQNVKTLSLQWADWLAEHLKQQIRSTHVLCFQLKELPGTADVVWSKA